MENGKTVDNPCRAMVLAVPRASVATSNDKPSTSYLQSAGVKEVGIVI